MNNWSWKKGILPILKGFTDRTEGSFIIEKESMLSWVYKDCDPDFGPIQANEMISHINTLLLQNDSIIVTIENEAVNIRPKNVNKGYFVSQILKQDYKNMEFYDLIMVIGDQDGDEEMFKYLNYLKNSMVINSKIYTVTIDRKVSNANYYLNEPSEILEYLENLNKEYKNDGNSSSKYSQEIYNMVDQTDEYDLYSKKSQSYYDI
jgi:trehalose 6-phosphate synthase/phosphatase